MFSNENLPGEDRVQAPVHRHVALEALPLGGDCLLESVGRLHDREVDQGRVAAMHGRRRVLWPFGLEQPLEVHRVVHVGIDTAGNHELAAGVDRLCRVDVCIGAV